MSKAAKIRKLLADGYSSDVIAAMTKTTVNYVCRVRWIDQHHGYKAEVMRRIRKAKPPYYRRELKQRRMRYHTDPIYRAACQAAVRRSKQKAATESDSP